MISFLMMAVSATLPGLSGFPQLQVFGEEIHAVLKEDLAGGFMPSKRFGANAVNTEVKMAKSAEVILPSYG